MSEQKHIASVCAHCGLPVQSGPVPKQRVSNRGGGEQGAGKPESPESGEPHLFCCFGCRMVWEMERHDPGDPETADRLSPLNLLYLRFALALIASIFLIFISLTLHFEAEHAPAFLRHISLLLATGVMILLAGPFLDNLKREITDRRLSLASLIFTGSGAAYLLSAWNTLSAGFSGIGASAVAGAAPTYFETSAMILTFYIGSLLLDTRIKRGMAGYTRLWQSDDSPEVLKIVDKQPEDASAGNLRSVRIRVQNLATGDRYLTEAGQPVLTDSIVTEGEGFVDESHLTGEPDPVRKETGETISAGSVSIDGGLVVRVTKPYHKSSLQDYLRQARAMRSRPGYYERAASRGASILLVFVMIAAFGGLIYHAYTAELSFALRVFLAVLLIGCPCAFSISTPAALWVANQRLHRSGVIAMGGSRALEKLSETKVVLFDKTGTLTEGVAFRSVRRVTDDPEWPVDRLMRLAGGLEMEQAHPFARALRRYLDQHGMEPVWPDKTTLLPGQGMEGWISSDESGDAFNNSDNKTGIDGRKHHVLMVNNRHPQGSGRITEGELGLLLDDRLMLRLRIYQPPRQHLERVIRQLQEENRMKVAVVTGDPSGADIALPAYGSGKKGEYANINRDRNNDDGREALHHDVEHHGDTSQSQGIAYHNGFSLHRHNVDYHQGCPPERKAELVAEYRKQFGNVMFVGDGTNDLMAINKADLGVGVYTGTLSIRNHADFVLFHPHLGVIPEMLRFSGKITGTIRGNFFWAVAYNLVGIGVALMGWLHPFFAILAMMLSSLFVTLHSTSLQRRQPTLGDLEKQVNNITEESLMRPGISET